MNALHASCRSEPIRTVLHLSTGVTIAALRAARREQLGLSEWLEFQVLDGALADPESQDNQRMGNLLAVQLFAHIANTCPSALTGQWRQLYECCVATRELWHHPVLSLAEIEDGADCSPK